MTTLYNCHTDGDQYRITKFDSLGNVESSYLCTEELCECPAGQRDTCRHRQMLPKFIQRDYVDSFYMFDFDRKGWVTTEPKPDRIPRDMMPLVTGDLQAKPDNPSAALDLPTPQVEGSGSACPRFVRRV